jgi:hypothetical protein
LLYLDKYFLVGWLFKGSRQNEASF